MPVSSYSKLYIYNKKHQLEITYPIANIEEVREDINSGKIKVGDKLIVGANIYTVIRAFNSRISEPSFVYIDVKV